MKCLVKLFPPGTFTEPSCAKTKTNLLGVASPNCTRHLQQAAVRPIKD